MVSAVVPGGPCDKEFGGGSIEEHDKIVEVDGKEHSEDNLPHVSTHCHCRNGMIPDACAQILAGVRCGEGLGERRQSCRAPGYRGFARPFNGPLLVGARQLRPQSTFIVNPAH